MNIIEGKTLKIRILKCVILTLIAAVFGPFLLIPGYRRLRNMPKEEKNRTMLKITLIIATVLYSLAIVYLIVYMTFSMLFSDRRPGFGENEKHVPWLMEEASDVSYYLSYSFTAYEFTITEENFRKYLSKRNLKEITQPVTLRRYNHPYEQTTVTIDEGLYTEESGMRGSFKVAFDRKNNRAYFEESPEKPQNDG